MGEKRMHQELQMMLGGRSAEKLIFDEFSAGAEDDLNRASQLARRMVAHWGMSETIGPVAFRQSEESPFLGKEIHEQRKFSEETARIIDREVQRFLLEASHAASQLLEENREQLEQIAEALLDREILDRSEIEEIVGPASERNA